MTADLNPVVDPLAGASPAQQADTLTGVLFALAADCVTRDLRPVGFAVTARDGLHLPSASVQFEDPAAVDALGDAYGLPPAGLGDLLHDRVGTVVVDGREVTVSLYCARPYATPALPVVAERADTPKAVTA